MGRRPDRPPPATGCSPAGHRAAGLDPYLCTVTDHSGDRAAAPCIVAIIPARGASSRMPGKNLRRVGGVPLVARAAASARRSTLVGRVVVTTDDRAVAAAARAEGAEIMARPARLSGDASSQESALLNVLERLDATADIVVFLQATSPFIDPGDLDDAIARVRDGECDVVFSAVRTRAFLWRQGERGAVGVNHEPAGRARRPDREPEYRETGAFYVMRASGLREARFRFFGRVGIAVVDERRAIEVNSVSQLELANSIAPLVDNGLCVEVDPASPIDADALVTGFDGVHTDDRVLIGADGSESITANRADGVGIESLRGKGVGVLIVSTQTSEAGAVRGRHLGVEVRTGVADKAAAIAGWAAGRGIDLARVAYLGNDLGDLGALAIVGWPLAVADARPEVRAAARVVLTKSGGHGAVREAADRILLARSSRGGEEGQNVAEGRGQVGAA